MLKTGLLKASEMCCSSYPPGAIIPAEQTRITMTAKMNMQTTAKRFWQMR